MGKEPPMPHRQTLRHNSFVRAHPIRLFPLLCLLGQLGSCREPVRRPATERLPLVTNPRTRTLKAALDPATFTFITVSMLERQLFTIHDGAFEGRLDRQGRIVVPPKYHAVSTDEVPNFKVFNGEQFNGNSYCGQRYGLLDSSGRELIPPRYELLEDNRSEYILFMEQGKAGYMDRRGRIVIPASFAGGSGFMGGFASVNVGGHRRYDDCFPKYVAGGRWRFIDTSGRFLGNVEFDEPAWFFNGRARVHVNCQEDLSDDYDRLCIHGQWGLLDTRGQWVLKPVWTGLRHLYDKSDQDSAGSTPTGLYVVCQSCATLQLSACTEACGVADSDGNFLVPQQYEEIELFGDALLVRDFGQLFGVYSIRGELLQSVTWSRTMADAWKAKRQPPKKTETIEENGRIQGEDYGHHLGICRRFRPPDVLHGPSGSPCETVRKRKAGGYVCRNAAGVGKSLADYDVIEDFNHGLAPVRKNGRWGFIDGSGELVLPPTLDVERVFPNLCHLSLQKDADGKTLFFYQLPGQAGSLSVAGRFTPNPPGDYLIHRPWKTPVLDDGSEVDDGPADEAFFFNRATEESENTEDFERRAAFRDKLEAEYDEVDFIFDSMYLVVQKGRSGLLDADGRIVLPVEYAGFRELNRNLAGVCHADDHCGDPVKARWRLVDRHGRLDEKRVFTDLRPTKNDGSFLFRHSCTSADRTCRPDLFGVMDRDGEVIFAPVIEPASARTSFEIMKVAISTGTGTPGQPEVFGRIGVRDELTKVAFPGRFDDIQAFFAGSFWVNRGCTWKKSVDDERTCQGGKWGLWSPYKGMLQSFAFESLPRTVGPYAVVGQDCSPGPRGHTCRRHGVMDFQGKWILPAKFSGIETVEAPDYTHGPLHCRHEGVVNKGTVVVTDEKGLSGMVDLTGKQLIPNNYHRVCTFDGGVARVMRIGTERPNDLYGAWGLVDAAGKEILPCTYGYISDFRQGVARIN
ncbi:MAG: hypothetical protein CVU59_11660, partial [Deltaproteobacteria bacterium HGW-Deltaproteobacteria-17]